MTPDEVTFDAPAPKPAKKKQVKKKTKAAKAAATPKQANTEPFPGMTRSACASGCNAKGCLISGGAFCGHPTKGAQIDQSDPAAVKRLQAAREQLRVRIDPNRFTD